MIKETLNGHIMSAMKAGDKIRTKALRAIKDGIMNLSGRPLTDVVS